MEKTKKTIGIVGAGAMGSAIAILVSKYNKGKVRLWDRNPEVLSQIRATRASKRLVGIKIPEEVLVCDELKETIEDSDLVVLAIPSFAVREICQEISGFSLPPILMISKGMEKDTYLLPFQVVEEVLGKKDILHLTGVGFASEIDEERPVKEVLASRDNSLLADFKDVFATHWLELVTTTDLLGAQLAGALKNVMVVGIGIAEGQEENPEIRTKIISEGVQEMIAIGKAMGAKEETFEGPAGKGDLELSADPLSRNYRYGKGIYQRGIEEIKRELQENNITVEGFHTAFAVYQLAKKHGVRLPIAEEVYSAIYERKDPKLSAEELIGLVEGPEEKGGRKMTNRIGRTTRKTGEVNIEIEIRLDEPSDFQVSITADKEEPDFGSGALSLFEHLFAQIYHHGRIGGHIKAHGDLPHHIIEDVGICWGQALKEALGDRRGIERFGSLSVPFEGSLASMAIDLSGRGYAVLDFQQDMDNKTLAGMAQHLFEGMALNAGFNIWGKVETVGTLRSDHHGLEAFCKAFGRTLHRATRITGSDIIPSTKGIL